MQPLRFTIYGGFWDSQIYRGKLYLFDLAGSIKTVRWDDLVSSLAVEQSQKLALVAAFLRSDFLYRPNLVAFYQDPDIKTLLLTKFHSLSTRDLKVEIGELEAFLVAVQDNPFPFPHADSEIYARNLFIAGSEGIQRATCDQGTKYPLSSKVHREFDAPVYSIAASWGTLAAAAGDEGLYEIPALPSYSLRQNPKQSSPVPCEDCYWTFQSIFTSSTRATAMLIEYSKHEVESDFGPSSTRHFVDAIPAEALFGAQGYAWGVQDKLCLANNGEIRIVKYLPWLDKRFSMVGYLAAAQSAEKIIAAASAPFGFIVEYHNGLVVYTSDGQSLEIPGEPVNWRVFHRSHFFENQLHVIYEDRLEILSFNHDYFLDQKQKLSGLEVMRRLDTADPLISLMSAPDHPFEMPPVD